MKIKTKIFIMLFSAAIFMSGSAAAFGATLSISSSGDGLFVLQGIGLADVGAIDATISYDTATLAKPRVSQGGLIAGAMMVPDTNSPGTIRIVIVTTGIISGSGPVASVRFDKKGASSGSILSLNAKLINLKGVSLPVQTQVNNPAAVPDSVSTANGQVALGQSGVNTSPETGGSTLQAPAPEASPDPA